MPDNTITHIRTQVRLLIDDTDAACYAYTDDQIDTALNLRRDEARYYPLTERETISAGGGDTTYLTFDAPVGWWENDAEIVNSSYNVLTPATSDWTNGRWTFSTEPTMPVMITGFTYDVYGTAGDLLLTKATQQSDSFDVSADGLTVSRNQKQANLKERAYEMLAKARTKSIHLVRTDEH